MIKCNNHPFFFSNRNFKKVFKDCFEREFLFNHFINKILRFVQNSRLGSSFLDEGRFGHGSRNDGDGDRCNDGKSGDGGDDADFD